MSNKKSITVSFGREGRLNTNKDFSNNIFIKLHTDFREEQLKELKGAKISVFICLALHMNEDGETFVSNKTIAKETGYSKKTVKNAKRDLVEKGYLHVKEEKWTQELIDKRFPKNKELREKYKEKIGQFATNTYSLFPEDYDKKEQDHREKTSPREDSCQNRKVIHREISSLRGYRRELFSVRKFFPPKKNYDFEFKKNYLLKNNNNKQDEKIFFSDIIDIFKSSFGYEPNDLQKEKLKKCNLINKRLYGIIEEVGMGGHNARFLFNRIEGKYDNKKRNKYNIKNDKNNGINLDKLKEKGWNS